MSECEGDCAGMAVTAIRTVIIYAVLIAAMRVMGRRQLGELQPVELVVTLLISEMAAVPMQESGVPLVSGLVPVAVLVAMEILLSGAMMKCPRLATLVAGKPLLLIHEGKLDQRVLKKLRMTVEDLTESLRRQGIFALSDVYTAIAETGGQITVYPAEAKRAVVLGDLYRPEVQPGMPFVVLADGQVCEWAMKACGVDGAWVHGTLEREGVAPGQVLLMTANAQREYTIVRKEETA